MSKLIISGNGKKNVVGAIIYAISFVAEIFGGVAMYFYAEQNLYGDEKQMFRILGIVLIVFSVVSIWQLITLIFRIRTKIDVYDDYITGDGLEKSLNLQNFKLTYDQISNVDVVKRVAVIIYTSYTKYTCYVPKCNEIRNAILKNKNL